MTATIGELCAGYGGLGMGVSRVIDAEVAWYSEIDKGALKVLEHRFPWAPNHGDMTVLDWGSVPPVDILCAGYPCQPFSHAGKRKGANDSRHLWPYIREAIRRLRPNLTILENVSGHRSLGFDRVLGDLAEDGMDVAWTSVRAADIGAPHRRERVFIAVTPNDDGEGLRGLGRIDPIGRHADGRDRADGSGAPTKPAPLFPTPAVNDMGSRKTVEDWDAWTERMKERRVNGNGHGKSLSIEVRKAPTSWGTYRDAVLAWEQHSGRQAPRPVEPAPEGGARLAPAFSEWMMGLPAGWVTDVPGITRNEALRALGNGVVPQQAAAAVSFLLDVLSERVAA